MSVKSIPKGRTRTAKPYCHDCRSSVRSLVEHRTTAKHRDATTSIRSSGPKGSHAYRPPMMGYNANDHDAWYEEQALAAMPPSIDDLFPDEIMDPMVETGPAIRGAVPEPCARCGKGFRTPAGRHWHIVHNVKCEKWRKVVAA